MSRSGKEAVCPSPTVASCLMVQLSTDDGKPKLICHICQKSIFTLEGYVQHLQGHEKGHFMCPLCEKSFPSADGLRDHKTEEHGPVNPLEITEDAEEIKKHRKTDISCLNCEELFGSANELTKHRKARPDTCGLPKFKRKSGRKKGFKFPKNQATSDLLSVLDDEIEIKSESENEDDPEIKSEPEIDDKENDALEEGVTTSHLKDESQSDSDDSIPLKVKSETNSDDDWTKQNDKEHVCKHCKRSFYRKLNLEQHIEKHHSGKASTKGSVLCLNCKAVFSHISELSRHRRYRRDTCGLPKYRRKPGPRKDSLKRTSRRKLTGSDSNEDDDISSTPEDDDSLSTIKSETKDKEQKGELDKNGEGDFACQYCNRRYLREQHLKYHILKHHTGDWDPSKSITCPSCKEVFSDNGSLSRHRKSRPDTCGLSKFNRKPGRRIGGTGYRCKIDREKSAARRKAAHEFLSKLPEVQSDLDEGDDSDEDEGRTHQDSIKSETKATTEKAEKVEVLVSPTDTQMEAVEVKTETEYINLDEYREYEDVPMNDSPSTSQNPKDSNFKECSVKLEDFRRSRRKTDQKDPIILKINLKRESNATSERTQSKRTRKVKASPDYKESPVESEWSESGSESDSQSSGKPSKSDESKKPKKKETKRRRKLPSLAKAIDRLKRAKKRDKPYECIGEGCAFIYHFRGSYEKHLRLVHNKTNEEIDEIFKDEAIAIPEEVGKSCPVCGRFYILEKRLKDHMALHGPDGTWKHRCMCYCNKYFATPEDAFEHAKIEHKDKIYCAECNKYLKSHDAWANHRRIVHDNARKPGDPQPRNLVCGKCGKRFASRTYLDNHELSDCGRNPRFKCEICGKCLTTAGILKTHLLLHKEDTPYLCPHCGKQFKVQAQCKTHIKVRHTDYKPFKCELCPKAYPYRESLLTHMVNHTGLKRFMCNGCGQRFSCISNLQAHRKVHATTCGLIPLNAKPTEYMGVQKGVLLRGVKPFS